MLMFAMSTSIVIFSIYKRHSRSKRKRDEYYRDCWVSMRTGFLPERNLERLSSRFDAWDEIGEVLADLNQTGKIQEEVEKMPLLDVDLIQDCDELRRAYVLLGMILQSYCKKSKCTTVPRQLAVPYVIFFELTYVKNSNSFACTDGQKYARNVWISGLSLLQRGLICGTSGKSIRNDRCVSKT